MEAAKRETPAPRFVHGRASIAVGMLFDGKKVNGWHRTDTSAAGVKRAPGGVFHTDIGIELANGPTVFVTLVTKEPL